LPKRIQSVHEELMAKLVSGQELATLKRLAALDRWERYALTNRRRAGRKFQSAPAASLEEGEICRNEPNLDVAVLTRIRSARELDLDRAGWAELHTRLDRDGLLTVQE
jgi:hypothetical protein